MFTGRPTLPPEASGARKISVSGGAAAGGCGASERGERQEKTQQELRHASGL